MTSLETQLSGPGDRQAWDGYVGSHPEATYCHRWAWKEVFEACYRRRCYYLSVRSAGEWVGVLPLVHMRGRLGGNALVSLPYLDQGGVLASSDAARRRLGQAALELVATLGASSIDLRGGAFDPADPAEESERFRFVLPLAGDEEALWNAVGGKVRNQVRKSEREGLETRSVGPGGLSAFYAVFTRNMLDLGSPVHSRRLFSEVLKRFDRDASLYLTIDATGVAVAGAIAVRFRDSVVVPWASSLISARPSCPNHSLYWRVLRDALAEGRRAFDFGRSSVGSGTYQFKKQWGAARIPLVWTAYDRQGSPRVADLAVSASGNERLAELWSRLPLALANRLGPIIRGRLPN